MLFCVFNVILFVICNIPVVYVMETEQWALMSDTQTGEIAKAIRVSHIVIAFKNSAQRLSV